MDVGLIACWNGNFPVSQSVQNIEYAENVHLCSLLWNALITHQNRVVALVLYRKNYG